MIPPHLSVRVLDPDVPARADVPAAPSDTIAAVLARAHVQFHLSGMPSDWRVLADDVPLPLDADLREVMAAHPPTTEYSLVRVSWSGLTAIPSSVPRKLPAPPRSPPSDHTPLPRPAPFSRVTYDDDAPTTPGPASPPAAGVRYFARMTLRRAFPLDIGLPDGLGDDSAFGTPGVEVSVVFPGCECATVPAGGEWATFWIIPQVVGRVPGARVEVRRGGVIVAAVALDVWVADRVPAAAVGLAGLCVPAALAGPLPGSVPLAVGAALLAVAGGLAWATRPVRRVAAWEEWGAGTRFPDLSSGWPGG